MSEKFFESLASVVGSANLLLDPAQHEKYVRDWFGRESGRAICVVRPKTTQEVAEIVGHCNQHHVPIVPQGGNTGLVGGGIPNDTQTECVLSLERMSQILEIDERGRTMTVQAGAILSSVHQAAAERGLEFPLTMGSAGSCTIGGMLATNAGGTAVLRYGNARALCLGLEVVTAQGEIWPGLRRLRKDNTGYDLRDLFIGSEGTLGIITSAVLSLVSAPKTRLSALVSLNSPEDAVALLGIAQSRAATILTAFELISNDCLRLVAKHFPQMGYPFEADAPYAVLIELSDPELEAHTLSVFEQMLGEAFEAGLIVDALIPQSISQSQRFWEIREHIPLAQVEDGRNVKHDISLPISNVAEFLSRCEPLVEAAHPGARIIAFGHLGDGNLHFNIAAPAGQPDSEIFRDKTRINDIVHGLVAELGGSISAEHGIGRMKAAELGRYKSVEELALFRAIKSALDPKGLLNPGKVLV